jgi:transposase
VKNLPGRKSDVSDCQWLQQLHAFGLLNGLFRPKDEVCVLRSFLRLRDTLVKDCSSQVFRMQKALTEMNIQVHRVLSDITGYSGMAIIRAILAGERDPLKLAQSTSSSQGIHRTDRQSHGRRLPARASVRVASGRRTL